MLFPYSIPLYRRKLGWEIISNKISYTVKDRQIPSQGAGAGLCPPCRAGRTAISWMLHAQFASAHARLPLSGIALAWEEYWRWDEDDTAVAIYYDVTGEPSRLHGVPHQGRHHAHQGDDTISTVRRMTGLWEFIRAHDSMIDEVHGNSYFNEPIAFEMDDGDIREIIRPYIMGRIVDVEQFFSAYACDPSESSVCFAFDIEDSFLEWNDKIVKVRFADGKCRVCDDAPDYTVHLSIATLTTLLLRLQDRNKAASHGQNRCRCRGSRKA